MFSSYDVKRLILAMAIQAEIEGMKIYNSQYPELLGYGEDMFLAKAHELEALAHKPDEEL